MKALLPVLCVGATASVVSAQPVITAERFAAVAGDVKREDHYVSASERPLLAGIFAATRPNATYDFSQFTFEPRLAQVRTSAAGTPGASHAFLAEANYVDIRRHHFLDRQVYSYYTLDDSGTVISERCRRATYRSCRTTIGH